MSGRLPKLLADVESQALFDLDLTAGAAALPSGWAVIGTGATWDDELGFNGGTAAYIRTDNFSARDALLAANSGYFYIEFEREAMCTDNTYSSGSTFYDSDGNTDTAAEKSLLWTDDGAGSGVLRFYRNAANYQFVFLDGASSKFNANLISRRSAKHDSKMGYLLVTWSGTSAAIIIDGNVMKTFELAAAVTALKRVYIGAYAGSKFLGAYHVRRIMCGTQYLYPQNHSVRVAVLGDSFIVAGSDRSEPADTDSTTIAELDSLQSSTEIGATMFGKLDNYRGQAPFVFQLQANVFNRYGKFLQVYNAGNSGNGWRTDVDAGLQIKIAYKSAAAAFNPQVVLMFGSVNDLPNSADTFDLEADLKSHIDDLLAASNTIKRIYLVQTFGWYNATHANADSAAWLANYALYVDQMSRVDGYRNKVVYVPNLWGAAPDESYLLGSHPDNSTTSADTDFHPSATGHTKIADTITALLDERLECRSSPHSLIGNLIT